MDSPSRVLAIHVPLFLHEGISLAVAEVALRACGISVRVVAEENELTRRLDREYEEAVTDLPLLDALDVAHPAIERLRPLSMAIGDDRGTDYAYVGGKVSGGTDGTWTRSWHFQPAAPRTAGRLTIRTSGHGAEHVVDVTI